MNRVETKAKFVNVPVACTFEDGGGYMWIKSCSTGAILVVGPPGAKATPGSESHEFRETESVWVVHTLENIFLS